MAVVRFYRCFSPWLTAYLLEVQKHDCQECATAAPSRCDSCRKSLVAKFIPPKKKSSIGINQDMLARLLRDPVPDACVLYLHSFRDSEGHILVMEEHQLTLRHLIQRDFEAGCQPDSATAEHRWLIIMLGIFACLANAHEYGLVHGDLKPSNSTAFMKLASKSFSSY